jgi:hypothetical protein
MTNLKDASLQKTEDRLARLRSVYDRIEYARQAEEEIFSRVCILLDNTMQNDTDEWADLEEMKCESEVRQGWISVAQKKVSYLIKKEEEWEKSLDFVGMDPDMWPRNLM